MPMPSPPAGGMEVLVLLRGIVQLGVRVGQLHAGDEQLESLGVRRVGLAALGQGTQGGRIVHYKRRIDQSILDRRLENLVHHHHIVHIRFVDLQRAGPVPHGVQVVDVTTAVLPEQVRISRPAPGPGQVDLQNGRPHRPR